MKEILDALHQQIVDKLLEKDISIEARNVLVEIKQEIEVMRRKTITIDQVDEFNKDLERFTVLLSEVK